MEFGRKDALEVDALGSLLTCFWEQVDVTHLHTHDQGTFRAVSLFVMWR